MTYKSVFTVLTKPKLDSSVLPQAADVARLFEAHLEVLCLGIDTSPGGYYFAGANAVILQETLSRASIDLCKRPYLIWKDDFRRDKIGEFDTELFKEFFHALAGNGGMCLHIENLYGENNHHIVESCYKGLARALRQAIEIDPRKSDAVPSTKGVLGGSL